jgi:tetratricopeptide (TPR) repeat protein
VESAVDAALRGLQESRVSGSAIEEAAALHRVGETYATEGQLSEALGWFRYAVAAYAALHHRAGCERALSNVGVLLSRQSKWPDAEAVLRKVLELARQRGDAEAEADASFNLSFVLLRLGKYDEAKALGRRSAELFRSRNDSLNLGLALGNVGKIERAVGDLAAALACQLESAALLEQARADRDRGEALSNLGNVYRDSGEIERARECFETALSVLDTEVDPRTRAGAVLNLGTVQDDTASLVSFRTARELFRRGEDKYGEAVALFNAGKVEMASADAETRRAGRHRVEVARDMLVSLGAPEAEHAVAAPSQND